MAALDRRLIDRVPCVSPGQTAIVEIQKIVGAEWPNAHRDAELMTKLAMASVTLGKQEGTRVPFENTMDVSAFGANVEMGDPLRYPYVRGHPFADKEAVDRATVPDPRIDGRAPVVLESVRRLRREEPPVLCTVTAPFTLACFLHGERDTLMDLIVDPPFLKKIFLLAEKWAISFVHEAVEAGADVIVIEDTWASGEILSQELYQNYAFPGETKLARVVHEMGARSILHQCGSPGPNLEVMAGSGVDGITIHQSMDVSKVKKMLSSHCAIIGNLDPRSLVQLAPEEIRVLAAHCVEKGIDVLAPSCGLDSLTPLRNLRAIADAVN